MGSTVSVRIRVAGAVCLALLLCLQCMKQKEKSVELKDFIVNLAEEEGPRYLKLKMKLVTEESTVLSEIADSDAKISDALITFLSAKKVVDLNTPMDKKVLKRQLIDLFNNKLLKSGDITDIYFINFVIQ